MAHKLPVNTLSSCSAPGTAAFGSLAAVTGFAALSAGLLTDDTTEYHALAVDGSGVRTGGWETGIGRWDAGAGTLARTPVFSSNSNAAVNFTGSVYLMVAPMTPPRALNWLECEFTTTNGTYQGPFQVTALGGGNISGASPTSALTSGHVGCVRINNTTTANSGVIMVTQPTRLAGGEVYRDVIYTNTPATMSGMLGALGGLSASAAVLNCTGLRIVNGVCDAFTNLDGSSAASASTYTLSSATWYQREVAVLTTSLLRCRILSDAGSVLWEDTVSATVPAVENRETYHGAGVWNTNTTSGIICNYDYLGYGVNRKLPGRP